MLKKYTTPEYDGLQTSPEILQAIEELYDDSILNMSHLGAYGAWSTPSDFEKSAIIDKAFELATDKTKLCWGVESVTRLA